VRRRFFVEGYSNGAALLEGAAAHHLANVLRAERGQLYELSDGQEIFLARVERVGRDRVEFSLLEVVAARAPRLRLTLLLTLVKFDRFEWALEKATELGVQVVIPLCAERSEKKLIDAAAKRADRWNKILLESAQQARCLRPPQLRPAQRPAEAFPAEDSSVRILLSERSQAPPLRQIFQAQSAEHTTDREPLSVSLAVGPEGGWTDAEFAGAAQAKFLEASLGELVLRTETAVIAALAATLLYFQPSAK